VAGSAGRRQRAPFAAPLAAVSESVRKRALPSVPRSDFDHTSARWQVTDRNPARRGTIRSSQFMHLVLVYPCRRQIMEALPCGPGGSRMKNHPKTSPVIRACLLGMLVVALAGPACGETARANFGASARVLVANQPGLSAALPLPSPGHLLQDDARGRHYVFDGAIESARDFYRDRMEALGYELVAETAPGADAVEMQFRRGDNELTVVSLRAAIGSTPTRIGLRAMRR
jgi:hypothetical protein